MRTTIFFILFLAFLCSGERITQNLSSQPQESNIRILQIVQVPPTAGRSRIVIGGCTIPNDPLCCDPLTDPLCV